jgi:hypothetical protein
MSPLREGGDAWDCSRVVVRCGAFFLARGRGGMIPDACGVTHDLRTIIAIGDCMRSL